MILSIKQLVILVNEARPESDPRQARMAERKCETCEDMKNFSKAYEAMEGWEKEFKRLLNELTQYPNKILQTTVEDYEEK